MIEDPKVAVSLVSVVVGVLLGLAVSELKDWWWRSRRRKAHWRALSAETELCREMAETFLHDNVQAPLYRLPTLSYLHSFPVLLADGKPTEQETRAVTEFYNQVETLNRGLDQTHEARDNLARLNEEFVRNRLKAESLVAPVSLYARLRGVLDQRAR